MQAIRKTMRMLLYRAETRGLFVVLNHKTRA